MSRMLQALKNLESRSSRPDSGTSVLAKLPAEPPAEAVAAPKEVALRPEPLPKASTAVTLPAEPEASPPLTRRASDGPDTLTRRASEGSANSRSASALEKEVRRTLQSGPRSQPYREAASRLLQDLPSGSGSVALIGIGDLSPTHDLALHLAAVLAEKQPVVLVDADLARGVLSSELQRTATEGLSDLLAGKTKSTALAEPTVLDGLALVAGGRSREAVGDIPDDRLTSLLQSLAKTHRITLLDAGRVADRSAPAIARLCDAAYLVVRLGVVEASAAERVLRDYRAAGVRVLGCIALT